jgi:hypothetical protein
MRLILSRKGFDSSAGGCPSPIFPDGTMLSLPIPDRNGTCSYAQLSCGGRNFGELVERLSRGKQKARYLAHLDPDLRAELMARPNGWRPALGQEGASQAHLARQGVCAGDLFLFWGLFQHVDAELRRVDRPFHALWGWLQVGEVADVRDVVVPAIDSKRWRWAAAHPHVSRGRQDGKPKPNCLYVAAERLCLPGYRQQTIPGAGVFERFRPELRLTSDPGDRPSRWALPRWVLPEGRRPLTYHSDPKRWAVRGDRVLLQTVGRGQEFVLDLQEHPGAIAWIRELVRGG